MHASLNSPLVASVECGFDTSAFSAHTSRNKLNLLFILLVFENELLLVAFGVISTVSLVYCDLLFVFILIAFSSVEMQLLGK